MPAFDYTCTNCGHDEVRIAGIDDHVVDCEVCGEAMVRSLDLDTVLASYERRNQDQRVNA